MTQQFTEDLVQCSVLHDIGKVGIPDSILFNSKKFGIDEFEVMKRHSVYGGAALEEAAHEAGDKESYLFLAKDVAYYHHERWDGSGYPFGLKGEEIPLSARIVAVADVYDALTTERRYKRSYSHEEARDLIVQEKSKQFDPELVETFLEVETQFKAIRDKIPRGLRHPIAIIAQVLFTEPPCGRHSIISRSEKRVVYFPDGSGDPEIIVEKAVLTPISVSQPPCQAFQFVPSQRHSVDAAMFHNAEAVFQTDSGIDNPSRGCETIPRQAIPASCKAARALESVVADYVRPACRMLKNIRLDKKLHIDQSAVSRLQIHVQVVFQGQFAFHPSSQFGYFPQTLVRKLSPDYAIPNDLCNLLGKALAGRSRGEP